MVMAIAIVIATLALGSRPKVKACKLRAMSEAWKSDFMLLGV